MALPASLGPPARPKPEHRQGVATHAGLMQPLRGEGLKGRGGGERVECDLESGCGRPLYSSRRIQYYCSVPVGAYISEYTGVYRWGARNLRRRCLDCRGSHGSAAVMMHSGYLLLIIAVTLMVANFLGAAFSIKRLRAGGTDRTRREDRPGKAKPASASS